MIRRLRRFHRLLNIRSNIRKQLVLSRLISDLLNLCNLRNLRIVVPKV